MRISHLHLDILDNTRQQIFEKLPVHTKNYYLSGGTGLALVHELIQLENGIQVASIDEIAAQKAYTIGRRGEYRDSERKYGTLFNSKLFLEQLVYFTDLRDTSIIPVSDERIPKPEQIKTFFEQEVKKYLSRM